MYVFITVAELTGTAKQLSLGQVEDKVTLEELLERCLDHIDKHLPEQDRDDSRHFWFNDRFVPFERKYLADLASTVNVTLELRPDHYMVKLLDQPTERYAINPELTAAKTLDKLLGFEGAWRCYQLVPPDGRLLEEQKSLFQQDILPFHARLSQTENALIVRRKAQVISLVLLALFVTVTSGILIGFLSAYFLKA